MEKSEALRKDEEHSYDLLKFRLSVKPSLDFSLNYNNITTHKGKDIEIICSRIIHFSTSNNFELIRSYSSRATVPEDENKLKVFPLTIINSGIGVARFSRLELLVGGKRSAIDSIKCYNVNESTNYAITFLPETMNDIDIILEADYEDLYGCLYRSGLHFSGKEGHFSVAPIRTTLIHLSDEIKVL